MSFSVNTNVASLQAQEYIRQNSDFQAKTIGRVTSGLRITQSGDDAAGLAIANGFRSDQAVLTQGIRNANDGLSQLQIIDGGINNISKLLDRARTLATQSASGTFTGDRSVLSSEFQSVLGEIDRQSQAVGLDTNGAFSKNLTVFIGGGRANVSTAIQNGGVSIDLSTSSVDSKSLGLKGVQAKGNAVVDLSSASATSVQNILANATNVASQSISGSTNFSFTGPGFSDAGKIQVSVNLNGVNDTSTLVTAINSAIQAAGGGVSSSATAFKNAGISASVVTDSATGKQSLAFSSSSAAFQVNAGDLTANALLGSISSGTTGNALTTTVTASAALAGSGTTTATTVRLQGGGLTGPVDISIASGLTVAAAAASLGTQIANNASLKAAGITLTTSTGTLQFSSSQGQKFSVSAGGDTANLLGLGSSKLGAASAFDYSTITGAAYSTATASGTVNLEFSVNGASSATTTATTTGTTAIATANTGGFASTALSLTIDGTAVSVNFANDPNKGGAETGANIVKYINSAARSALGLGANVNVASLDGSNNLILTSPTSGSGSSLSITANATSAALGVTVDASTNLTATAGTGTNGVSINLAGGSATAATAAGTLIAAGTVDTTAATLTGGTTLGFTIDGISVSANFTADANKGATETLANIALFLNTAAQKATGSSATLVSALNGTISITSATTGLSSAISIADTGASSISRALNLTTSPTALAAAGTAPTGTDIANRLNTAFAASSTLQADGLQASFASGALTISSSNGTKFQVNSRASTNSDIGFGATGVAFAGNAATATVANSPSIDAGGANQIAGLTFSALTHGNDDQTITVSSDNGGVQQSQTIHLQNNTIRNARSIDEAISTINTQLQQSNNGSLQKVVAVKDDTAGVDQIRFISNGSFSVSVGANASGNGVGSPNTTTASTVSAGGSTADISNQSNAQTAVTALSSAISSLGKSQAVVGRGQNQLNYAVNLAQSQVGNLAASESRIRDADLASEAANLTKASITLQAGIAALAQANSAPQAILALLRG